MGQRISNAVKKNYLTYGILIVIFGIVLLLNQETLYTADDYIYRFVYHTPEISPHMQRISTTLIPYSMWNHYMNWNGRFVAHSIVQFFMQFDSKVSFNIANSLIFVVLLTMINNISVKLTDKKKRNFILPLIFLYLWFFLPAFGQSVLWVSGAGNYLWMSVIYLGFIIFNLKYQNLSLKSGLVVAILGFLTGASNENSGPAAVLIVIIFMIRNYLKMRNINWNGIIGVVFSGLGFVTMMLSPGTRLRGAVPRSLGRILFDGVEIVYLSLRQFYLVYFLILALVLIGLHYQKLTRDTLFDAGTFLIGHLASIFVMVLSPEHPLRTFFGGAVFLGIALFILIYQLGSTISVRSASLAVVLPLVVFGFSFTTAFKDIDKSYEQVSAQYHLIEQSRHQKIDVAIMKPAVSSYNAYDGTIGLTRDPNAWMNLWEAQFFQVDKISGHTVYK